MGNQSFSRGEQAAFHSHIVSGRAVLSFQQYTPISPSFALLTDLDYQGYTIFAVYSLWYFQET